MKVRCDACTLRRDGQYLITYRATPGASTQSALSPVAVEVGRDCVVREGKVVR